MKFLSYSAFFLMLFAISSQTIAQDYNILIQEKPSYATGLEDKELTPEGINMMAALNFGDDIWIDFETEETNVILNLNIYDVTGKLILSEKFKANNTKNQIRVKSPITSRGIYIISLNSDKNKCVKKFYL